MIRLGIISDTHKELKACRQALEQMGKIDCLLHGGDHFHDACELSRAIDIQVQAVAGNCDWLGGGPEELILRFENVKVLLTHGHRYKVKSGYDLLLERAVQLGVRAVVFGHTHQAYAAWQRGILLLNPGSLSLPRGGGKPSFGILTVDGDSVTGEIWELATR